MGSFATPLHAQLREALIQQITSGAWKPGSQIPSERDLCKRYNVSRTTTRRTISECVHEGWLYTVVGKGTYVARTHLEQELEPFTGFSDDLRRRGIEVTSHVLGAENLKAPDVLANRLGLLPRSPIYRLHRVRLASGKPLAVQVACLPEHLCPDLFRFDFVWRSLYDVLREEYGLRLVQGRTTIKAGLASSDERRLLALDDPSAVLRTSQTTYLDDGRPVEHCESVFHGGLYEMTFTASAQCTDGSAVPDT
jgi:GntR family transcriptional regulator